MLLIDRLSIYSIILLSSLVILHFLGASYLQATSSPILQNQVTMVPIIFSAFGTGLFLIKGCVSYKAMEKMVSRAAIVEKYYKTKIVTNVSLQTVILFSDLTAFYALAMFSFVLADGHMTTYQKEVYDQIEFYAFIFIPAMSLVSIWLERRFSASNRYQ